MSANLIFGVVVNNFFYSNRMEFKLRQKVDNGIYSMDMDVDDFQESIAPANIDDACKFFRKASKIKVIRGISFHDGIIPENPVSFEKIPIKVKDATYEEFEEIEAVQLKGICYFLRTPTSGKAYTLMDLKEALEAKKPKSVEELENLTPEMRLVYSFHLLERKQKEMLEPLEKVKNLMFDSGANVLGVKKVPRGYEISWKMGKWNLNTLVDPEYKVIEAGFCVSGFDKKHSTSSISNLCRDYVKEHGRLVITRDGTRQGWYGYGNREQWAAGDNPPPDTDDEYDEYDE